MCLLADYGRKERDADQAFELIKQSDDGGSTPLEGFATQVDVCDVLIANQAGINVQAQDGYKCIIITVALNHRAQFEMTE